MSFCKNYTFNGIGVQCKDKAGGIKEIWVLPADKFRFNAVTSTEEPTLEEVTHADLQFATISQGVITGWSNVSQATDVTNNGGAAFYIRKNTGSMTTTLNYNENAGNSFSTECVVNVLGMNTSKRLEFMGLWMTETRVVVKDNNGKYWILGQDYGVEASAGTGETGTAMSDANQFTVTLKDDSRLFPRELSTSSVSVIEQVLYPVGGDE